MERTYTVKIERGDIWVFKYNLNGVLIHFNVLEGDLTEKHSDWLYKKGKFPYLESHIKDWQKNLKQLIIEVGDPDLSFDALWDLYNHKAKKHEALNKFKKLSQSDVVKCFMSIKGYDYYLSKKGTSKALLATFIHQRYYEDDWYKAV